MVYIVFIIVLFIASVTAHVFFCRKAAQQGLQARAFIIITMIALGIYILAVAALQYSGMIDPHSLWGLPFRITAGIIFILLAPIYLCFYVLTQLTSPSKKILSAISQSGTLPYSAIVSAVEDENFVMTRLTDLCTSGCVRQVSKPVYPDRGRPEDRHDSGFYAIYFRPQYRGLTTDGYSDSSGGRVFIRYFPAGPWDYFSLGTP